jgi:hypothetical protein
VSRISTNSLRPQVKCGSFISLVRISRIAHWRINVVYLKSVLAGIGGSILALILLVLTVVAINVLRPTRGMVAIIVVGPIPIAVAALGFILGFYLVFRR